ncbi:unnamed protein product [Durusdinium trenchii]|uniref:DRBM domain-containing protein n=1 Tax=Durusdinium trenchii TaxID=1381693 RepID=A0ABP0LWN6_9DINO
MLSMPGTQPMQPMPDFKSELNQFLQKHTKRPLGKNDIEYTINRYGHQQQAIVKLHCMDGQEYAGHLCLDQKSAEKSAAEQALQANAHLVQALKEAGSGKRPAPKSAAEDMADKRARMEENPALTPKTELNSLIGKIAKKVLAKGETIYVSNRIGNQYQATVQSVALPDEWAQRAWAGELCATRQKAEQSAAEQALKDIKTDPVLMAEAMTVKNKQGAKVPVGKKGWGYMMEMMKNFLQNGGTAMFREAVTTDFVTGSVIEWKGKFGWIKPDSPIDHEWAKYRDGKIWVSKQDLSGLEELSEGQRVQFKVYVDPSGLGAEETSLA